MSMRTQSLPTSQKRYCISGCWSSPSWRRKASPVSGLESGEKVISATGSPGAACITRNEMIVTPKKVGIPCNKRRRIYWPIYALICLLMVGAYHNAWGRAGQTAHRNTVSIHTHFAANRTYFSVKCRYESGDKANQPLKQAKLLMPDAARWLS